MMSAPSATEDYILKNNFKQMNMRVLYNNKVVLFIVLPMAAYLFAAMPTVPNAPATQSPAYLEYLQGIRQQNPARAVEKHSFLVIGGTGFTGGVIVDDLLARNAKHVRVISRKLPTAAKRKDGVEYVSGSITNLTALICLLIPTKD